MFGFLFQFVLVFSLLYMLFYTLLDSVLWTPFHINMDLIIVKALYTVVCLTHPIDGYLDCLHFFLNPYTYSFVVVQFFPLDK